LEQTEKSFAKMPILHCDCGMDILISPDLHAMNIAINNHLYEHKKVSGKDLTEDQLTQRILQTLANELPIIVQP
jgi:hypothetical protein